MLQLARMLQRCSPKIAEPILVASEWTIDDFHIPGKYKHLVPSNKQPRTVNMPNTLKKPTAPSALKLMPPQVGPKPLGVRSRDCRTFNVREIDTFAANLDLHFNSLLATDFWRITRIEERDCCIVYWTLAEMQPLGHQDWTDLEKLLSKPYKKINRQMRIKKEIVFKRDVRMEQDTRVNDMLDKLEKQLLM